MILLSFQIFTLVSSLGLNEQEIGLISHVMGGPHPNLHLQQGQPLIHQITDTMTWILRTYGYSETNPTSRLTRVHFHCLTFHIIGTVPGKWSNTDIAVAAGTRRAGQIACDKENLSSEDLELRIPLMFTLHSGAKIQPFESSKPVQSFQHLGYDFFFSPVLVCKQPLKTVGLGDAISATGLIYSEYLHNR